MKRVLATFIIGHSCLVRPQGTVEFSNVQVGGPNAPVYQSDGVTKLSGPQYMAELLGGPSADSLASAATTSFFTGNGAGYFDGGAVAISGVLPGDIGWVQVEVWNTASGGSFDQA